MKGVVFSSFTNAYAILIGAKKLGVEIYTLDKSPAFPIPKTTHFNQGDCLFFTEENSLRQALCDEVDGRFYPASFSPTLLDDKYAFVEWLELHTDLPSGLRQWTLGSIEEATYPCLLKAKHSWVHGVKQPRGWVCRSINELQNRINDIQKQGFNLTDFFIQEWLGDTDCRIISVCGFHDSDNNNRNITATVERIASHTKGLSCSAAVETIVDQWGLETQTTRTLNALCFSGPFELEFLVRGECAAILELNPRFWMQHAIFLSTGNGLIKRYLDMDTEHDREIKRIPRILWIDGLHLVRSIIMFRLGFVTFTLHRILFYEGKILIWPSIPMAIQVWTRIFMRYFRYRGRGIP